MGKLVAHPLVVVLGALVSSELLAEENNMPVNPPVYHALTECITSKFYDGGYTVGDEAREALMTEVSALKGQPPYSEALYEKIRNSDISTAEFMPVYLECIGGDLYEKVNALAAKHGVESEEY
ncbi:MAG: hypothetical protein ABWY06_12060 [Pseudomonas sp.]|uniref:hypothetical protein n=1 Tax=Pseudomonas sp. TaxID=306 RepID=UPI003397AEE5